MNPTDYINLFWKEDSLKPFSPNETRLYFFLLSRWINQEDGKPFECSTHYLETHLLLPKMTITRCREKLQQRGIIQYIKGDRKVKNPFYFLCGVTNDVTNSVTKHVTNDVTNQKEEIPPTPPKEENIIYNNKETSSTEDVKKAPLPSHTSERMDWGAFMQTFNDMLSPGVPKLISMSQSRRDKVKAIVKEYGKESIMQAFDKIRKSDFLMGRNRRPNDNWKCNFDFIFSKSGFIKILEGNYDNNGVNQTHYSEKRAANEEVFRQFITEREQRASGMVVEVEKPF